MNDSIIALINSILNRLHVAERDAKDLIIAAGDGDTKIDEVPRKENRLMESKNMEGLNKADK